MGVDTDGAADMRRRRIGKNDRRRATVLFHPQYPIGINLYANFELARTQKLRL